jgi:hypothetical protein
MRRPWILLAALLLGTAPLRAANLLTNPDFDSGLAGWGALSGGTVVHTAEDASGDPGSGSARITVNPATAPSIVVAAYQCLNPGAGTFDLKAKGRLLAGQTATGNVVAFVWRFAGGSCFGNATSTLRSVVITNGTAWDDVSTTVTVPSAGDAVLVGFGVVKSSAAAQSLVGLVDEVFFGTEDDPPPPACMPSSTNLCLNNSRFAVNATYRIGGGAPTAMKVSQMTTDTGYLYFTNIANVEAVVKVINGCSSNSRYWVFAAGLTNVEVTLNVTDTQHATTQHYVNPAGTAFAPVQDTSAFATCP